MSSHAKSRSTCIAMLPSTLNSLYKGMQLTLKLPQRFVDKTLERWSLCSHFRDYVVWYCRWGVWIGRVEKSQVTWGTLHPRAVLPSRAVWRMCILRIGSVHHDSHRHPPNGLCPPWQSLTTCPSQALKFYNLNFNTHGIPMVAMIFD